MGLTSILIKIFERFVRSDILKTFIRPNAVCV